MPCRHITHTPRTPGHCWQANCKLFRFAFHCLANWRVNKGPAGHIRSQPTDWQIWMPERSFVLLCNIHAKFVQLLSWIALRNIKPERNNGMGQLLAMCAALWCWHKNQQQMAWGNLCKLGRKLKKEWVYRGWRKGNTSQNIKGQKRRLSQERPRERRGKKQFLKRSTCTNSFLFALIIPRWNGKRDARTQKSSLFHFYGWFINVSPQKSVLCFQVKYHRTATLLVSI